MFLEIKKLMELDKALRARKSVRKFSHKAVSWEHLSDILEAGTLAPSSGNVQNWVFIVLRKRENIEHLVELLPSEQSWASKASVLVVVCNDVERIKILYGGRGEALYAVQNCAAAMQNMLLKAADLGIGSCWIGYFDEKVLAHMLDLDKNMRPQAILAFGYGEPQEFKGREPLQSSVFFEKFGNKTRDTSSWSLDNILPKKVKK